MGSARFGGQFYMRLKPKLGRFSLITNEITCSNPFNVQKNDIKASLKVI